MSEHKQMQPPDYHRCLDTVFGSPSPAACREMHESNAELVFGIRRKLESLNQHVTEWEGTADDSTAGA
ncbi:hypothetical protein Rrhod_1897 [Rhodococcus rhodnii LMG 5362]|uniref:Uncharacterized protein n=1 Tax=Rhodococcus rhodnii LMG 5362 TaxID=1273125 RepID=R7WNA3_9NOCA|nr:hypothetical protein Rrhod_1897 [Rhodococcus rhodnii LMG 5362]